MAYRLSATPVKISAGSSAETEKLILKFMWRDFLDGPAVSTPHFQRRGQAGSQIDWRTKIPQAILHGQKKKKKSCRNARNLNNLENEEQSWRTYTS